MVLFLSFNIIIIVPTCYNTWFSVLSCFSGVTYLLLFHCTQYSYFLLVSHIYLLLLLNDKNNNNNYESSATSRILASEHTTNTVPREWVPVVFIGSWTMQNSNYITTATLPTQTTATTTTTTLRMLC